MRKYNNPTFIKFTSFKNTCQPAFNAKYAKLNLDPYKLMHISLLICIHPNQAAKLTTNFNNYGPHNLNRGSR